MLEKDYNIYIVDDVFDDNFACDFKAQSVEEKYGDSDEKIEYIKGIILEIYWIVGGSAFIGKMCFLMTIQQ